MCLYINQMEIVISGCCFSLTPNAVADNSEFCRFSVWRFLSLTLGWRNRGTACGRQEGGDEDGGGQSEAPKGSEGGLLHQSVPSWPRPGAVSAPGAPGVDPDSVGIAANNTPGYSGAGLAGNQELFNS